MRRARRPGATWSPNTVTYSGNNRTHMIRIPEANRFEFRLPDGAANPYLLQAAHLGRRSRRHPEKDAIRASAWTSTCIPRDTR